MMEGVRCFNEFQKLADEVIAANIVDIGRERVTRQVQLLQLAAVLVDGVHQRTELVWEQAQI